MQLLPLECHFSFILHHYTHILRITEIWETSVSSDRRISHRLILPILQHSPTFRRLHESLGRLPVVCMLSHLDAGVAWPTGEKYLQRLIIAQTVKEDSSCDKNIEYGLHSAVTNKGTTCACSLDRTLMNLSKSAILRRVRKSSNLSLRSRGCRMLRMWSLCGQVMQLALASSWTNASFGSMRSRSWIPLTANKRIRASFKGRMSPYSTPISVQWTLNTATRNIYMCWRIHVVESCGDGQTARKSIRTCTHYDFFIYSWNGALWRFFAQCCEL